MSKKIFSPKRRRIPMSIQRLVRETGLNRCAVCRRGHEDGVELHIDHIVPWMETQDNSPENLQLLCRGCNAEKGPRLPGETLEEEKARLKEYNRRIRSTPEFIDRLNAAHDYIRTVTKTPKFREPFEAGMAQIDRAKWREETRRAVWDNPDVRARRSASLKAYHAKRRAEVQATQ